MTPAAGYPPQAGGAGRNRARVLMAFASVYVIWGSTYLFIKYAIETIPPFLMGGTRFIVAGLMLYAFALWRGDARPTAHDWKSAAVTGVLMLSMGNGAVMFAELTVQSGVVALIVSTVPIWIVLLDWLRPRGVRPRNLVFVGLALGVVGMVILIGPRAIVGEGHVDEIGVLVLFIGSLGWALGSILTRGSAHPGSKLVFSALQMLAGGVAMLAASFILSEPGSFSIGAVSLRSWLSWVYLVLAGSLIGFTAYIYLLGAVSAAKAATYAYVNPIIAVLLGWAFAEESIGWRTIVAAAVILGGVAIITSTQSSNQPTGEYPVPDESKERERPAA